MRGDRVEIVVDTGDGVKTFDVVATKAGRRVETSTSRSVVEVVEVTRGGTVVRSARFMANRVVALVEYPAAEQPSSPPPAPIGLIDPDATSAVPG